MARVWLAALAAAMLAAGCGQSHDGDTDAAGTGDGGGVDGGGVDGGGMDGGGVDGGGIDAAGMDSGGGDSGGMDAGGTDSGGTDSGPRDAARVDSGGVDSGATDAGRTDAGACVPGPASVTRSPGRGFDAAGVGTVMWRNTDGVIAAGDGTVASAPFTAGSIQSRYLRAAGFGFSIPMSATIRGIQVTVRKRAPGRRVNDIEVRLAFGTILGTGNRAMSGTWPMGFTNVMYGGATDRWAGMWTPVLIDDPGFGVALSAGFLGGADDRAVVDHIEVTVHYNVVCP